MNNPTSGCYIIEQKGLIQIAECDGMASIPFVPPEGAVLTGRPPARHRRPVS